MFTPVILAALAAIVFYVLAPIIGAFFVRSQWRNFRQVLLQAINTKEASFDIFKTETNKYEAYRVMGAIEAIGSNHEIWIQNKNYSCIANIDEDETIYILQGRNSKENIERIKWKSLTSIDLGARILIFGQIEINNRQIIISHHPHEKFLLLIHNDNDKNITRKALWFGRHENEYWNPITKVSLVFGIAAMSAILLFAVPAKVPSLVTALLLCIAFSPILPLLPPGVVLFFVYRRFWKQARYCRARRDVDRFENRPNAKKWEKRSFWTTSLSIMMFILALCINFLVFFPLLRHYM